MLKRSFLPIFLLLLTVPLLSIAEEAPEKDVFVAIYNNDMEMLDLLLSEAPKDTVSRHFGKLEDTPLHRASLFDRLEMVGELIRAGADVNSKNRHGVTPLHYAVTTNSLDCIRILLRYKANVNAAGTTGLTPLHLAATFGYEEAAKVLLKAGANTSAIANNRTPADCAIEKGHTELAALLKPSTPVAPAAPSPAPTAVKPAPTAVKPAPPAPTAVKPAPAAPAQSDILKPTTESEETFAYVSSYKPDESKIRRQVNFDRSVYEGEMLDKKAHGFGTLRTVEGHQYEGFWKKGKRSGTGIFTYANGNRYVGPWENDVPHGEGHFSFSNGGRVNGTWKHGRLWEGTGILLQEKDTKTYKCIWEDGECVSQMEVATPKE